MLARIGATLVALAVPVLLGPTLLAGTAAADVTVAASRAESGARDVTITFRVTNDDVAAPVVRLQVFLPTARPLEGVVPTAPTGWTARVDTAAPTAVPATVTWEGGPLDGAYAVFPIDVARLPDGAGPLRFRVVQTDAAGGTVEWSDLLPYGAPAPAHPALLVPYGPPGAVAPTAEPAHRHHGDPAGLALPVRTGSAARTVGVVVLVAALVAVWAAALGRRQRRRLDGLRGTDERR